MASTRARGWMGLALAASAASLLPPAVAAQATSGFRSSGKALAGDVRVARSAAAVTVDWPSDTRGERTRLTLSLDRARPLIESVAVGGKVVIAGVDPAGVVTVGTRDLKQGWTIFFDNPRKKPFEAFPLTLGRERVAVERNGAHTRIVVAGARAGPFSGDFAFTIYPGSRLIRAAMMMATERPATAYTFDAGLSVASKDTTPWQSVAYTDLSDRVVRRQGEAARAAATSPQVRGRMIVAEQAGGGAIGIVPPPHQYYYPLDYANNDNATWYGSDYRVLTGRTGLGVRQTLEGDRRWVPWVNAPEKSVQDMGIFYLPDPGDAASTTAAAMALTRVDRFKPLPGYHTFSSHYHVEHAADFLNQARFQQSRGVPAGLETPAFVTRFKDMNVEIVHLAELHLSREDLDRAGDRLTLLKTIHDETARLSDDRLLLLPGEEPNVHLGGHWLSLFPRPVNWTLDRQPGQPFVEDDPVRGKVYHVGTSADVLALMKAENGLMWTAHPRIKGSLGFPDKYRAEPFFRSDRFLGGAWKSMPADYSKPYLGSRVLDLLDDMNNWAADASERKFAPGEVDVFQLTRDSELYAHMNINYLRLPGALPTHAGGWSAVTEALRAGHFFTTTGEVLVSDFTLDGTRSGDEVASRGRATLRATVEGTFPLAYALIVSGDGEKVFRERVDLTDAGGFAQRTIERRVNVSGRRWVRLEVWDVAANGAYTQPVFLRAR
ncbi:hypothetical protein [Sphingomonas sp. BK580]|uniref:hypothetical protein n=1 Tax=Sphingomonas sp. BK580 TaxID=2586972 RepID=UPI001609E18C|nr:hypothetical protein [Sphingomonas sp. BK580]MBB3695842.1 hypothetical protein [Sphingomonas sp. BK580]